MNFRFAAFYISFFTSMEMHSIITKHLFDKRSFWRGWRAAGEEDVEVHTLDPKRTKNDGVRGSSSKDGNRNKPFIKFTAAMHMHKHISCLSFRFFDARDGCWSCYHQIIITIEINSKPCAIKPNDKCTCTSVRHHSPGISENRLNQNSIWLKVKVDATIDI